MLVNTVSLLSSLWLVTLTSLAFLLVDLTFFPTTYIKCSTYFPLSLKRKESLFHLLSFGLRTLMFYLSYFGILCLRQTAAKMTRRQGSDIHQSVGKRREWGASRYWVMERKENGVPGRGNKWKLPLHFYHYRTHASTTSTHTHIHIYIYMQPLSLCFTLFENTLKILTIKWLTSIKLLIENKMMR